MKYQNGELVRIIDGSFKNRKGLVLRYLGIIEPLGACYQLKLKLGGVVNIAEDYLILESEYIPIKKSNTKGGVITYKGKI